MRTTISPYGRLAGQVRRAAAARGIGASALIAGTLDDALNRRETPQPPFGLVTVRGARARPGVDLDRTRGLAAQDDEARFGRRMP